MNKSFVMQNGTLSLCAVGYHQLPYQYVTYRTGQSVYHFVAYRRRDAIQWRSFSVVFDGFYVRLLLSYR